MELYLIIYNFIFYLVAQSLVDETINKEKYYNNNVVATNGLLRSISNWNYYQKLK